MMNEQILKYFQKNGNKYKLTLSVCNDTKPFPFVSLKAYYKSKSQLNISSRLVNIHTDLHINFRNISKNIAIETLQEKKHQRSRNDNDTNERNKKQSIILNNIENNLLRNIFRGTRKKVENATEVKTTEVKTTEGKPSSIVCLKKMRGEKKQGDEKEKEKEQGEEEEEEEEIKNGREKRQSCISNKSIHILNGLKHKNILDLYNYINSIFSEKKVKSVKYFSSSSFHLTQNKKIKISKLKLTEILDVINKHLTSVELKKESLEYKNEKKIWEKIFTQIEKLTTKETNNEESKKEILLFFQNLTNMEMYKLLNNLKEINDLIKKEVYDCLFFECFAITIRERDITFPMEKGKLLETYKENDKRVYKQQMVKNLIDLREDVITHNVTKKEKEEIKEKEKETKEQEKETKEKEKETKEKEKEAKNEKEERKTKSYLFNIKSFLNKKGSNENRLVDEQVKGVQEKCEEKGVEEGYYKQENQKNKEKKEVREEINKRDNEMINYIQKENVKVNGKDVRMIRQWLYLLSHFSNNFENFLIIKDYLNKMFQKNVDELISINYFVNTVDCLTNQINSKSIQAIIRVYEKKLSLMKAYDFSYSLIILSRYLILSHNIFHKIIDTAVEDPISLFENEKHFLRFIKSVDNYPLVNTIPSKNGDDIYSFQNNMNDMYNLTFAIFLKKLSFRLQDYSLNNLLYISECLGKVLFIPSAQNQSLFIFINKLRFFIDQSIDLLFVNNYTLIRLFKISSSFSFVPESYVFVMDDNVNKKEKHRRHSLPIIHRKNTKTTKGGCGKGLNKGNHCNDLSTSSQLLEKGGTEKGGTEKGGTEKGGMERKKKGIEKEGTEKEGTEKEGMEKKGIEKEGTEKEDMNPKKKKKSITFKLDKEEDDPYVEEKERNGSKQISNYKNNEKIDSSKKYNDYTWKYKNDLRNNFLKKYDKLRIYNETYEYHNYVLRYDSYNNDVIYSRKTVDIKVKNEKNKFLLKNIIILLCSKFEKTIDEIVTKEMTNNKNKKNKETIPLTKERLIKEIKLLNEKNTYGIDLNNLVPKNLLYYDTNNKLYKDKSYKDKLYKDELYKDKLYKDELYKEYLIFYDINTLIEIIKFTSASINTNKYVHELIKPIKKRLNEIFSIYSSNEKENATKENATKENATKKDGTKKDGTKENTEEEQKNEVSKIKNIHTFQLYKLYCAVKNLSPSYLLSFFDILIKLTPKIKIINIERNVDLFNKKYFWKSEYFKKFETIYNENITIPFVVSLLQALKMLISSNIFESNNSVHDYINIVIQYSYYALFYCYYNKEIKKKKKEKQRDNKSTHVINNKENVNTRKLKFPFAENEASLKKNEEKKGVGTKEEEEEEEGVQQMKEFTHYFENKFEGKKEINSSDKIEKGKEESSNELKFLLPFNKENYANIKNKETSENYNDNYNNNNDNNDNDKMFIKNFLKRRKNNKDFCFFEKMCQDNICNIYVCLSTVLYFVNGNENMQNEIKHLIYLENAYLNLLYELKLIKYLSDNDIFYLFKSPLTEKLEEKLDGVITILKNVNQKRLKQKSLDLFSSSFSSSLDYEEILSLPSLTAFFLCKAKLSITCNNDNNNNSNRIEKTLQLCKLLISEYNILTGRLEELFQHKGSDISIEASGNINSKHITKKIEKIETLEREKHNINLYEGKEMNINKTREESNKFLNKFSNKFQKIKSRRSSNAPYFVSNKNLNNSLSMYNDNYNVCLKKMISDMFFGSHEIETIYDLQNGLLKTIKYVRIAQINFTLNHKFVNILPIHNDILSYLSELANAINGCLYSIFLSQPYVHKNPRKYCTKSLINYFINRCELITDGNSCDDTVNKFNNELKMQKFITSIM